MASVSVTEEDRKRVTALLPPWFKPEPGFRFMWERDEAVVIGWGGWRNFDLTGQLSFCQDGKVIAASIGEIKFHPATLVVSYCYKGEWHLTSVENILKGDHDDVHPLPEECACGQRYTTAAQNEECVERERLRTIERQHNLWNLDPKAPVTISDTIDHDGHFGVSQ